MALYLHGSRALGSHREDSDYDYAYLAPHGAPVEPVEDRLLPLLAEHHATDEREIDLQNLRQAPPYFRVRVFEHGQLLYCGDSTELARFQTSSLSESWDLEIFLRPFREAMLRRIREGRFAS